MKTKIKAAIVLNPHETALLAAMLSRRVLKNDSGATNALQAREEVALATEFIEKNDSLQRKLGG